MNSGVRVVVILCSRIDSQIVVNSFGGMVPHIYTSPNVKSGQLYFLDHYVSPEKALRDYVIADLITPYATAECYEGGYNWELMN